MLKVLIPLALLAVDTPLLLATSGGLVLCVLPLLVSPANPLGVFLLDGLSVPLILLTVWLLPLMLLAASVSPYALLVLTGFLLLAFGAPSFSLFYVFFEASLLPTAFLVLVGGYQPERLQAVFYLILYTASASLPLLVSLALCFLKNGHLSFFLPLWGTPLVGVSTPIIWAFMMLVGFMVKTPIYTLHLWLPKAHVEAPVTGSMALAGTLLKLGTYGTVRLLWLFPNLMMVVAPLAMGLTVWGASVAGFSCLRQTDTKALIAYSSVTHMGTMMAGIFSMTGVGWSGAVSSMVAHGLTASALFAMAALTYMMTQSRSLLLTRGGLTVLPQLTAAWFLGCAANMGAPPSLNCQAEILLLSSVAVFSLSLVGPLGLVLFLSAAYSLHLYSSSQHGAMPSYQNVGQSVALRHLLMLVLHGVPVLALMPLAGYFVF